MSTADTIQETLMAMVTEYDGHFECAVPVPVWGTTPEQILIGCNLETVREIGGQECRIKSSFSVPEGADAELVQAKCRAAMESMQHLVLCNVAPVKKVRAA